MAEFGPLLTSIDSTAKISRLWDAGIAHAVQVGVALGVEAANERTVALRVATFTGTEGDARNGAQRVLTMLRAPVSLESLVAESR